MNDTSPSRHSPFVPVLILSLALNLFLAWQFSGASQQRSSLRQLQQTREAMITQSRAVQSDLQQLCIGLLELAQTDPAARELVQRYGISPSAPVPQ
jgi:hypothetical protein